MKVEVVDCSTHQTSQTYLLPEAQVSDFKELEMTSECIPMTELRHLVKDLETFHCEGTEDSESIPVPVPVDFYLPTPVKTRAFSLFAEQQSLAQGFPEHSREDVQNKIIERASSPDLNSRIVLWAVLTEVLQNHHPLSDFKVRISDE